MRKVIFSSAMSLDGYIARKNGEVNWLSMEDLTEATDDMKEFLASVDTVLMGHKTYEKCLEFGQNGYDGFVNYLFTKSERESLKEN